MKVSTRLTLPATGSITCAVLPRNAITNPVTVSASGAGGRKYGSSDRGRGTTAVGPPPSMLHTANPSSGTSTYRRPMAGSKATLPPTSRADTGRPSIKESCDNYEAYLRFHGVSSDEVVEGFTRDEYEKQLRENKEKGHECYGQPEVRYARKGSAAICYGASMYRPGKTPAVITIRNGAD